MKYLAEDVLPVARAAGFDDAMVEKVLHLIGLLNALNAHQYLKGGWALKGGTALNLFVFDLPRLSVDIDLNYIGAVERDAMQSERPNVEAAVHSVFSREGLSMVRIPLEHAGGKWRVTYPGFRGQTGALEVDLNFMFRLPLWDVQRRDSHAFGPFRALDIPVLDTNELAAGKLAALLSRQQARDLFDSHRLLTSKLLDPERLRLAFTVYGAMNRRDWRTVSPGDVDSDPVELARRLLPTLNTAQRNDNVRPETLGKELVEGCRAGLSAFLPLRANERAFLDRLLDRGDIDASLLTSDASLQERISRQPLLAWKAQNVRLHGSG